MKNIKNISVLTALALAVGVSIYSFKSEDIKTIGTNLKAASINLCGDSNEPPCVATGTMTAEQVCDSDPNLVCSGTGIDGCKDGITDLFNGLCSGNSKTRTPTACGGVGEPACARGSNTCGTTNNQACGTNNCDTGLYPVGSPAICTAPCGGANQPACASQTACEDGSSHAVCTAPCGGVNQPACASQTACEDGSQSCAISDTGETVYCTGINGGDETVGCGADGCINGYSPAGTPAVCTLDTAPTSCGGVGESQCPRGSNLCGTTNNQACGTNNCDTGLFFDRNHKQCVSQCPAGKVADANGICQTACGGIGESQCPTGNNLCGATNDQPCDTNNCDTGLYPVGSPAICTAPCGGVNQPACASQTACEDGSQSCAISDTGETVYCTGINGGDETVGCGADGCINGYSPAGTPAVCTLDTAPSCGGAGQPACPYEELCNKENPAPGCTDDTDGCINGYSPAGKPEVCTLDAAPSCGGAGQPACHCTGEYMPGCHEELCNKENPAPGCTDDTDGCINGYSPAGKPEVCTLDAAPSCGGAGQPPCEKEEACNTINPVPGCTDDTDGCINGYTPNIDGVCTMDSTTSQCGDMNQIACETEVDCEEINAPLTCPTDEECVQGLAVNASGVCVSCGGAGQIACDTPTLECDNPLTPSTIEPCTTAGCDQGLLFINGVCSCGVPGAIACGSEAICDGQTTAICTDDTDGCINGYTPVNGVCTMDSTTSITPLTNGGSVPTGSTTLYSITLSTTGTTNGSTTGNYTTNTTGNSTSTSTIGRTGGTTIRYVSTTDGTTNGSTDGYTTTSTPIVAAPPTGRGDQSNVFETPKYEPTQVYTEPTGTDEDSDIDMDSDLKPTQTVEKNVMATATTKKETNEVLQYLPKTGITSFLQSVLDFIKSLF